MPLPEGQRHFNLRRTHMIPIKEAIIVEGKYDKIKLSSIYDTIIISTGGFGIFTNEEKQRLIQKLAKKQGIIILTDSDRAGFLIRNFLCGIVDNKYIKHAYIPQRPGKESRKTTPSKDGFLGVEGISKEIIANSIKRAATIAEPSKGAKIKKSDLFAAGLCGREGSSVLRNKLLKFLDLPVGITANPLLSLLNSMYTPEEFESMLSEFRATL